MSLKSRLKASAKFDHQSCDGRFCDLEDHPEMQAIKRLDELEKKLAAAIELGWQIMNESDMGYQDRYGERLQALEAEQ